MDTRSRFTRPVVFVSVLLLRSFLLNRIQRCNTSASPSLQFVLAPACHAPPSPSNVGSPSISPPAALFSYSYPAGLCIALLLPPLPAPQPASPESNGPRTTSYVERPHMPGRRPKYNIYIGRAFFFPSRHHYKRS